MGDGRPRKKPAERRTNILKVCLTESERAELDQAGGGTTSAWARVVLLREARRKNGA